MKIPNDYMAMSYRMEIVEDKDEGGFVVSYPDLPGCITCGETVESAVANALDAKKAWFEAYFQNNDCETLMQISRLMQSLKISLTGNYKEGKIKRTLLDSGWFAVNQRQLDLYKKLYRAICESNKYWYKTFSGIYSDDLVSFIALLQFMNHFSDADEIRKSNIEMQPEYYNAFVCESLNKRYKIMRNKLPIEPILKDDKNYFYNQRGAIVYKDISNQPMLPLHSRKNEFMFFQLDFHRMELH